MYTPLFILNVFNNFLESELCFMCLERVERDIAHRINLKHSKVVCNLRIISKLKVETEFKISYKWTHITYCDHAHIYTFYNLYHKQTKYTFIHIVRGVDYIHIHSCEGAAYLSRSRENIAWFLTHFCRR